MKEPWQMTKEEYIKAINPGNYRIKPSDRPTVYSADIEGMYSPNAKIISKGKDEAGNLIVIRREDDSYYAEVNGRPAGYALELGDGSVDVTVAVEFQGHGIGTELDYLFRKDFPMRLSGGMTLAGERTVRRVHKKFVEQALSEGRPVPQEVLKEYPDLTTNFKSFAENWR